MFAERDQKKTGHSPSKIIMHCLSLNESFRAFLNPSLKNIYIIISFYVPWFWFGSQKLNHFLSLQLDKSVFEGLVDYYSLDLEMFGYSAKDF